MTRAEDLICRLLAINASSAPTVSRMPATNVLRAVSKFFLTSLLMFFGPVRSREGYGGLVVLDLFQK